MKHIWGLIVLFLAVSTTARANGTVTGHVIDRTTTAPLFNVTVSLHGTGFFTEAVTDNTGVFSVSLPADNYFAEIIRPPGYVSQVYQTLDCVERTCANIEGNSFLVQDGSTISGIDFSLQPAGRIGGVVTNDAGIPLQNVGVQVYFARHLVNSTATDSNGVYLIDNLEPDIQYFAAAYSQPPYLGELYDNIPCYYLGCDVTDGTLISVTAGAVTPVSFSLTPGGTISGTVATSEGGPIFSVVVIYDQSGKQVGNSYWGTNYQSTPLPAGIYYAQTQNLSGYVDEIYDDIPCSDPCGGLCNPASATPIVVNEGTDTPGIDFTLGRGGGISGKVTDAASSDPLSGMDIEIYNALGTLITHVQSDGTGNYFAQGLLPGSYYVAFNGYSSYLHQVYMNYRCNVRSCPPTSGTPVPVVADTITPNIDLALIKGGTIQGTITDSVTGELIGASIYVFNDRKNPVPAQIDSSGGAFSVTRLPAGSYYLVAISSFSPYLSQVYDGQPCVPTVPITRDNICDLSSATLISVSEGTTSTASFALDKGGMITGTVTDSSGSPQDGISIRIYDQTGLSVAAASTDLSGRHTSNRALPEGDYYVVTVSDGKFVDQIFPGVPCVGGACDLSLGTPVHVQPGAQAVADFELTGPGQTISGRVTDAETGFGIFLAGVQVYNSNGKRLGRALPDILGNYHFGGLTPGTYYLATNNSFGTLGDYTGQLYNGFPCFGPLCDVTSGTPVTITGGADVNGINFALVHGGRVSGTVRDALNGEVIPDEGVVIFDAGWHISAYGSTDCAGHYTTSQTLPTGNYFGVTLSQWAYLDKRWDDAACIDTSDCDATLGQAIHVIQGEETTGIDYVLRAENKIRFVDDFEDEILSQNWTYPRGKWAKKSGTLFSQTPSIAVANPVFPGCSQCSVEAVMNAGSGSASLLGWYTDSLNYVELKIDPHKDTWTLRQWRKGRIVAKQKAKAPIDFGLNYRVTITFNGSQFKVGVNGAGLLSMKAFGSPAGTVGLQVNSGNSSFGEILVY